jgi:competence protein ComEC
MLALGGFAVLADRRPQSLRVLGAAFIALLLASPGSSDTLSFQLSFCALSGILVFGRWLDRLLLPWVPAVVRTPLSVSVGAQLATLPLVVAVFGAGRPVGVAATLVMGPLAVLFVWGSVLGVLLVAVPGGLGFASPVTLFLEWLRSALIGAAELFSRAPGLRIPSRWLPVAGAGIIALAFVILYLETAPVRRLEKGRER